MNVDETRAFEIDINSKPKCGLDTKEAGSKMVELEIKKSVLPGKRVFKVVGYERDAFVQCSPGHVPRLKAEKKTQECGIGKILMQL